MPTLPAEDFGRWLEQVNSYNPEYRKITTDQEPARINRTKGLIEAADKGEEYSVELAFFMIFLKARMTSIRIMQTSFKQGSP